MASILDLVNHVQKQGELGRERGTQTRLGQLYQQAYTAPRDQRAPVIGEIAKTGGLQAASGAQKVLGDADDDLNTQIARHAQLLLASPPERRAQMYPAIADMGRKAGLPIPEGGWDEAYLPGMEKMASALGGAGNQTPSGYRQFELQAQAAGLRPGTPEYQQAAKVALGVEGRASNAGFGFEMIEGADGRKRMRRTNPRTGVAEVYDENTGDFVPMGGAAGQSAPAPQRQPMAPGEVPFSIDPSLPPEVQASIRANPQQWATASESQPVNIGQPPQGRPSLGVGMTPAEKAQQEAEAKARVEAQWAPQTAAATEGAKIDAQLDRAPRVGQAEADAAARKKAAEMSTQRTQEAISDLPKIEAQARGLVEVIDKAINHPGRAIGTGASSKWDPRNYVPGTSATDFSAVAGQIEGKAFLQAFESLKGGGTITEREGTAATAAIARLNRAQSDSEYVAALMELRKIASDAADSARAKAGRRAPAGGPGAKRVTNAAEYNALPSGALYIAPDGSQRRKK